MPKQMALRYFERNKVRIKRWIEQRHDSNPYEDIAFDEFLEEFPADEGWDKPSLEWFLEEYLYNLVEQQHINKIVQEMELLFDNMVNGHLRHVKEQEIEYRELQREYREVS